MPVVSRYLEQLARAQFYRSEHGTYWSDESAFYFSGRVVSLLPILHAVIVLAIVQGVASALGVPELVGWGARAMCLVPFLAAAIWLTSNTAYLQLLRQTVRSESAELGARRRSEAKYFVRASYICGIVSFVLLAVEQATRHGT